MFGKGYLVVLLDFLRQEAAPDCSISIRVNIECC